MFVVFDKKTPLAMSCPRMTHKCIGVVRRYIKELDQKGNQSRGIGKFIRQKIGAPCMIILKSKQSKARQSS